MNKKSKVYIQNDHLILPKATLKRFADPVTKKVKYLDLSNPEIISIKERFPDSFHTEPNYYIPEHDKIIKRYESMIGQYNKRITDIYQKKLDIKIDDQRLKTDILDILNIQFQRTVIVDDEYLKKLLKQFEERYHQESLYYICQGIYPVEFQKRKQEFDQVKNDKDKFRDYIQCILGQKNQNLLETYRNFVPHILIIPNEVSSTFVLSPQHFVASDTFARIIISPRIALALFPTSITKNNELIKYLTKGEVDNLAPRTIESALSMTNSFREIIGEEDYLNCIKDKLHINRSIICHFTEDIVWVKGGVVTLNDDQSFLELAVSIKLFEPDCHKVIIELNAVEIQFMQKTEFIECVQMFRRWELALVFINNSDLAITNKNIKVAQNKEEAITMF